MNSPIRSAICLGLCPALLCLCPAIDVAAASRPATRIVAQDRTLQEGAILRVADAIPSRDPVRQFANKFLDENRAKNFSDFVESTGVTVPANEDSGRPLLFLLLILAIVTGAIP